jgi:hypothetical protein
MIRDQSVGEEPKSCNRLAVHVVMLAFWRPGINREGGVTLTSQKAVTAFSNSSASSSKVSVLSALYRMSPKTP